eukprot:jgi/Mesvir1/2229/Mv14006-RA.1
MAYAGQSQLPGALPVWSVVSGRLAAKLCAHPQPFHQETAACEAPRFHDANGTTKTWDAGNSVYIETRPRCSVRKAIRTGPVLSLTPNILPRTSRVNSACMGGHCCQDMEDLAAILREAVSAPSCAFIPADARRQLLDNEGEGVDVDDDSPEGNAHATGPPIPPVTGVPRRPLTREIAQTLHYWATTQPPLDPVPDDVSGDGGHGGAAATPNPASGAELSEPAQMPMLTLGSVSSDAGQRMDASRPPTSSPPPRSSPAAPAPGLTLELPALLPTAGFDGQGDSLQWCTPEGWAACVQLARQLLPPMLQNYRGAHRLTVQEPFFSQLRDGSKRVEGRCATPAYSSIMPGALLLVNGTLLLRVSHVRAYASFGDMLAAESLEAVLPGTATIELGVAVYRQFYSEEKERTCGVLALVVERVEPGEDPVATMATILKSLGLEGMREIFRQRRTVGSLLGVFPPSRRELLASFSALHPKSRDLTVGARAFCKHAHRCSSNWWGDASGSVAQKNARAAQVVDTILQGATWMNVHRLPHDLPVFEARVAQGYGARWSADGSQFRGFVEPQMPGGHEAHWRH